MFLFTISILDETCVTTIEVSESEESSQAPSESAVEASPARPTRRRRTRSCTKSPSPEPRKVVSESTLEPLAEVQESAEQEKQHETSLHSEKLSKMEVDNVKNEENEPPTKNEAESEKTGTENDEKNDEKGTKRSREDSKSPSRKRASSVEPHANDFTSDEDEPVIDDSKYLLSWGK